MIYARRRKEWEETGEAFVFSFSPKTHSTPGAVYRARAIPSVYTGRVGQGSIFVISLLVTP